MKAMIVALLLVLGVPIAAGSLQNTAGHRQNTAHGAAGGVQDPPDSLRVMFWNLENFFDWRNDSTSVSEGEFSSRGERRWTRKRFQAKADAIAKSILWAASREGGLPDVIGFAEVENAFVLRCLLQGTALRKLDYRLVHFDSPDPRGIDVALLYRSSRLELVEARPCHLFQADSLMLTRDILLVHLRGAEDIAFLVNHHPSKYGGTAVSGPRRRIAVERLRFLVDSAGIAKTIAMGDFNDTPDQEIYEALQPVLRNQALPLHERGEGTIKFQGKWELIDHFYVSEGVGKATMKILQIPFLMVQDKAFAGDKPLRTYSGPRYLGGVSDHCPIWLTLTQ